MKDIFLYNYCCVAIAFVCITVAAINFENAGLLWWYILAAMMLPSTK